jgi:hypothetical protein
MSTAFCEQCDDDRLFFIYPFYSGFDGNLAKQDLAPTFK